MIDDLVDELKHSAHEAFLGVEGLDTNELASQFPDDRCPEGTLQRNFDNTVKAAQIRLLSIIAIALLDLAGTAERIEDNGIPGVMQ